MHISLNYTSQVINSVRNPSDHLPEEKVVFTCQINCLLFSGTELPITCSLKTLIGECSWELFVLLIFGIAEENLWLKFGTHSLTLAKPLASAKCHNVAGCWNGLEATADCALYHADVRVVWSFHAVCNFINKLKHTFAEFLVKCLMWYSGTADGVVV